MKYYCIKINNSTIVAEPSFFNQTINMRFKIIIIFSFCLFYCIVKAQNTNVFPASPNTSALMEYINLPISLDTGIPTINYKLLSIKSNEIEVPVTISYHAAGIKVNEVPSWAGTGWTLNAGGAISRTIIGLADEVDNGFIGTNQNGKLVTQPWTSTYIRRAGYHVIDTEPDIFYFNFLNFQGKFVFNAEGDIVMLPHQELKIIPPIGPKKINSYWIIIDGNGNKYKFGTKASSIETMTVTKINTDGNHTSTIAGIPQISAWYLCEIESSTGDKITFDYKNGSSSSFDNQSLSKTIKQFPGYNMIVNVEWNTVSNSISNPVYLDKIISTNGYIKFNSLSLREDFLNSYKIDNIQLIDKNETVLKKINFEHSYFQSSDCSFPECKRLKLDQISLVNTKTIQKLYQFSYNTDVNLPSRNSPQIDHWGYYNQNGETAINNGNLIIRAANYNGTKANILQKIYYSTGGDISFEFELNDYNNNGTNSPAGGLRVSKITENYNNGTPIIREYSYKNANTAISSGTSFETPTYASEGVTISDDNTHNWSVYKFVSHSLRQLFDLNGSNVKYQEVKIKYPDNSFETNYFTNFISNPDIRNNNDYRRYMTYNDDIYIALFLSPFEEPFAPPSFSNFNERGFLTKKIYKNGTGQIVYLLENTYKKINPLNQYISSAFSISPFARNTSGTQQVLSVGNYQYKNDIYVLDTTKEIKYDLNNILNGTETITEFTYSAEYPTLKISEVTKNSDTKKHKTVYKYPFDLITENLMSVLKDKNYINNPIIEEKFVDEIKIFNRTNSYGNSVNYFNNGNIPLLKEIKEDKISSENNNINFEKYDMNGRLLQFSKADNVHTSIIWGYNSEYPIAKLENISYDEIPINIISLLQSSSNMVNETGLPNAFMALRNESILNKAMITTYTYKPLIGVSSITDPKGLTTYYEYDSFNRLVLIKDQNSKILKTFCYNYQNQVENCVTVIEYKNIVKTDTFKKNGCVAGYGGSSVVYTVAAGKYSSTLSQSAADNLAVADVAANGQAYANTNGTCGALPAAPTGLTITSVTASSITLSWTAVAGATGYIIYLNGIPRGSSSIASGTLLGLPSIPTYNIQVKASNAFGEGVLSSSVIILGAPTGLVFSSATASSINFSWTAVAGATGYKIYKDGVYASTIDAPATNGSLSGLTASTSYNVQVLATNASGDGILSSSVAMTTKVPPLGFYKTAGTYPTIVGSTLNGTILNNLAAPIYVYLIVQVGTASYGSGGGSGSVTVNGVTVTASGAFIQNAPPPISTNYFTIAAGATVTVTGSYVGTTGSNMILAYSLSPGGMKTYWPNSN